MNKFSFICFYRGLCRAEELKSKIQSLAFSRDSIEAQKERNSVITQMFWSKSDTSLPHQSSLLNHHWALNTCVGKRTSVHLMVGRKGFGRSQAVGGQREYVSSEGINFPWVHNRYGPEIRTRRISDVFLQRSVISL